ncbi:MAG: hypothetical protein MJZ76_00145 [Bacteroidales bacterium]|nr:hypothetical protein [Bacteroidales bacterium]
MTYKKLAITLLAIFLSTFAFAQQYNATAKIDSNHILIGDYLNVHLSVSAPQNTAVIIPQPNEKSFDTLGIEWISNSKIDTLLKDGRQIFSQTFTVTAFDSGEYIFPIIPIFSIDSQLIAQTQPLNFVVNTIAVDTTAAFRDIKQPIKVMITFREILPYLLLGIAAALIIALIVYLIRKYYKKKNPKKTVKKSKPKEKPHIIALSALEALRVKHLWQDGKIKPYYSELTDIIREYIDNRWEIDAPEMTSSEILEALQTLDLERELTEQLRVLFTTADLVKFAKSEPLPNEHDLCFKNAVNFVQKTMEITDNQSSTKQTKKL